MSRYTVGKCIRIADSTQLAMSRHVSGTKTVKFLSGNISNDYLQKCLLLVSFAITVLTYLLYKLSSDDTLLYMVGGKASSL